ncbi:MAG: hypothetical protein Q9217_006707 [Psora testacea]
MLQRPARMCSARKFNWAAMRQYETPGPPAGEMWRAVFAKGTVAAVAVAGKNEDDDQKNDNDDDVKKENQNQQGRLVRSGIPRSVVEVLAQSLDAVTSLGTSIQDSRSWVLRNLTMREYVRLLAPQAVGCASHVDHPDALAWLRLDDVLLMRVLWSPGNGQVRGKSSQKPGENLYCGSWAGHAFDVVALPQDFGDEWEDVTCDVVEQATVLCEEMRRKKVLCTGDER